MTSKNDVNDTINGTSNMETLARGENIFYVLTYKVTSKHSRACT